MEVVRFTFDDFYSVVNSFYFSGVNGVITVIDNSVTGIILAVSGNRGLVQESTGKGHIVTIGTYKLS